MWWKYTFVYLVTPVSGKNLCLYAKEQFLWALFSLDGSISSWRITRYFQIVDKVSTSSHQLQLQTYLLSGILRYGDADRDSYDKKSHSYFFLFIKPGSRLADIIGKAWIFSYQESIIFQRHDMHVFQHWATTERHWLTPWKYLTDAEKIGYKPSSQPSIHSSNYKTLPTQKKSGRKHISDFHTISSFFFLADNCLSDMIYQNANITTTKFRLTTCVHTASFESKMCISPMEARFVLAVTSVILQPDFARQFLNPFFR